MTALSLLYYCIYIRCSWKSCFAVCGIAFYCECPYIHEFLGLLQSVSTKQCTYFTDIYFTLGPGVAWWLRRCNPGIIPGGVTWDIFRGFFWQNHLPWGRLSLWKWVPGISPGVKAAGVFGWRPTTLVVPKVEKIRGLNLPGTPRATSACHEIPLLLLHISPYLAVHVLYTVSRSSNS